MTDTKKPNILLIVSDQERQRDWIPKEVSLPARQRLLDGGLEFTRYYTHTSPCSPSRGTLFTGQYLPVHGVTENCIMPANGELSTDAKTLGKLLRGQGYYTGDKGKWHLAPQAFPDMDAYGFSDWEGNDKAFWGQAGSGVEFDEPIARSAADWIRNRQVGGSSTTRATPIEGPKLDDADAEFDEQEHEFYDLREDPNELVNLAIDRGRRNDVLQWYRRLIEAEASELTALR